MLVPYVAIVQVSLCSLIGDYGLDTFLVKSKLNCIDVRK